MSSFYAEKDGIIFLGGILVDKPTVVRGSNFTINFPSAQPLGNKVITVISQSASPQDLPKPAPLFRFFKKLKPRSPSLVK